MNVQSHDLENYPVPPDMEYIEIIEKYRDGAIYERTVNGIPIPISDFEKRFIAWATMWDVLPKFIEEHRIVTGTVAREIYKLAPSFHNHCYREDGSCYGAYAPASGCEERCHPENQPEKCQWHNK